MCLLLLLSLLVLVLLLRGAVHSGIVHGESASTYEGSIRQIPTRPRSVRSVRLIPAWLDGRRMGGCGCGGLLSGSPLPKLRLCSVRTSGNAGERAIRVRPVSRWGPFRWVARAERVVAGRAGPREAEEHRDRGAVWARVSRSVSRPTGDGRALGGEYHIRQAGPRCSMARVLENVLRPVRGCERAHRDFRLLRWLDWHDGSNMIVSLS